MASDLRFFVAGDDINRYGAFVLPAILFAFWRLASTSSERPKHCRPSQISARARGVVFADSSGKYQQIQSTRESDVTRRWLFSPLGQTFRSPAARGDWQPRLREAAACRSRIRKCPAGQTACRESSQFVDAVGRVVFVRCKMWSSTPGSRSPGRVPMMMPPVGVRPMVVSMERPSRTAVMLAPLPRWATISRGGTFCPSACRIDSQESP